VGTLSIVTINLNNQAGLQKTFESVINQTFKDYEYIIIDGGSTDGSREFVASNDYLLKYWISEKDNGVYAAMNKGISNATGEYLLFLNAGDFLVTDTVLERVFCKRYTESILYGNVKNNLTGNIIRFPDKLRFSFFREATINHQASFIKRELFSRYGLYNEHYQIAADWEFFLRCIFLYREPTVHLGDVITEFDFSDGISSRKENWAVMKGERSEILEKYFPGFLEDYEDANKLMQAHIKRNEESLRINRHFIKLIRKMRRIVNS
jgi:glycosyltransferase involved in cell wall biosynthesis